MSLVTNPKVQLCQPTPKNLTQAMYVSCRWVCTSHPGLRSAFWICQCRRPRHNIPKEMPIFIYYISKNDITMIMAGIAMVQVVHPCPKTWSCGCT